MFVMDAAALVQVTALVVAFVVALGIGPGAIGFLRRLRFGQTIRADGPAAHLAKTGTPTMGGVFLFVAFLAGVLIANPGGAHLPWILLGISGFTLIGLADDAIKLVAHRSLGLRAREKLLGQILLSGAVGLYVAQAPGLGTALLLPGTDRSLVLSDWLYVAFVILTYIAAANTVNLADGLDGLAAGTAAIAAAAFWAVAAQSGAGEAATVAAALVGACVGFIWFNAHPADVFMGDTGSLALGAALASLAVFTKNELLLVIIGGVYVLEGLSDIIQVVSFRLTGKRVFRMAPLHHHFELLGWKETKVVIRFWIAGLLFALGGLLLAPGRF